MNTNTNTRTAKPRKTATATPATAANNGGKVVPITRRRKANKAAAPAPASTPVRFPTAVLAYLQIALEGPLGPGGVAHRVKRYTVTVTNDDGDYLYDEQLVSGACLPTVTRQVPTIKPFTAGLVDQTAPTVVLRDHSAAFAQAHGVTRCTQPACWPLTDDEQREARS